MVSFLMVNRPNSRRYNPHYQRHHLVPLQAASVFDLASLTGGLFRVDDFETNGILLPCEEREALRSRRPLHRGPHPLYNEMVMERIHSICRRSERQDGTRQCRQFFDFRIALLQAGLRRGLTKGGFKSLRLNRRDPVRNMPHTHDVDAIVDDLCAVTGHQFSRKSTK